MAKKHHKSFPEKCRCGYKLNHPMVQPRLRFSAPKWVLAHVDLPAPEGPTSTTRHGDGRTTSAFTGTED